MSSLPEIATDTPSLAILLARMRAMPGAPAVFADDREWPYAELLGLIESWRARLVERGISQGSVCALFGDYSPDAVAVILALFLDGAVVVPFIPSARNEMATLMQVAGAQHLITLGVDGEWTIESNEGAPQNDLVASFRERRRPGLIVFTSGSSGVPKGVLHDGELLLRKFVQPRQPWRTILFLSMDHLGGLNTLFASLAYGGTAISLPDRSPEAVARTIARSRATLLPTTPTFLNLLAASGIYRHFDLTSIVLISYGTEAMPEATLTRVKAMFPSAEIKQTYGLSELGVLRSKSLSSDSTWVQVGGPGFEVKIVDNLLYVRSESNMVGYLNAPSPFDADGWMCTGDEVETRGEYVRIIGRRSDMINVGGQKVSPLDVESILLQAPNVAEATVRGVPHPMMGQVVQARVSLADGEDREEAVIRLRRFCLERLPRFKVPVKFEIVPPEEQRGDRFKKVRNAPVSPA
ncbi:MAG: long-chain fatty acid--CoA ligase [Candidatus Limnocylindria bacterium]